MLLEELKSAQSGNEEAMLNLITKFMPLFKKYERKLGYEDAINDLIVDFIEFVTKWNLNNLRQSSDGAIVNYIAQSIYHSFIQQLKYQLVLRQKCTSFEDLTPTQLNMIEKKIATSDEYRLSNVISNGLLTPREKYILSAIYERGMTVASLANALGVSRQNINQIKKKALAKLKLYFESNASSHP